MTFTVEFTHEASVEFDDRARYAIDGSGALHVTTPEERLIYAPHAWLKLTERQAPATQFV